MPNKIMIVRHAEKPDKVDAIRGVDPAGQHDKNELSPQGWQRSGALIRFFNPLNGKFQHPALAKPTAIFAAAPSGGVKSLRSQHTVQAVAQSLRLRINPEHPKGEEQQLVKNVLAARGVVLIAWEHNAILDVANLILGSKKNSPQHWPDSRFDLVWIFDRLPRGAGWKFTQVPQMLLPTDRQKLI
jgi:hypothetical protein